MVTGVLLSEVRVLLLFFLFLLIPTKLNLCGPFFLSWVVTLIFGHVFYFLYYFVCVGFYFDKN